MNHIRENISKIYELVQIHIVTDGPLTEGILGQTKEDAAQFIDAMQQMVLAICPSGNMRFERIQGACKDLEQMSDEDLIHHCQSKGTLDQNLCDKHKGFYIGTRNEFKGCKDILKLNNNKEVDAYTQKYCEFYSKVSSGFGVVLKQSFDNYKDYVRLSINPNCSEETNVSEKFPISLVYNSSGTPQLNSPFVEKSKGSYLFSLGKPGDTNTYKMVSVSWGKMSLSYYYHVQM